MKSILNTIVNLKPIQRRQILRYLRKDNPELWAQIVSATSFLPDSASAPQRVWHIMNDINEVQVCKTTGKMVNWISYDQGYCKQTRESHYATVGAKIRATVEDQGHWRNDEKKAEEASEHFQIGMILGLHVPFSERDRDHAAAAEKAKKTCIERYGVDNYRKSAKMKERLKEITDERYRESRESRDERTRYYADVKYYTEKSWNEHFYDLTENRKYERSEDYHLDHIYSRAQGFRDGIPAEIIGHWTNLRLISRTDNSSKRDRCDKTKEQLMDDYYNIT